MHRGPEKMRHIICCPCLGIILSEFPFQIYETQENGRKKGIGRIKPDISIKEGKTLKIIESPAPMTEI